MASSKKLSSIVRTNLFKNAGPVAQVHMVADAMRGKSRREVIAKCVEKGINEFTARTQYQRWFAAH